MTLGYGKILLENIRFNYDIKYNNKYILYFKIIKMQWFFM